MANVSISSILRQAGDTFKAYPIIIILTLIVLDLLWNKFQRGLVNIPGPPLAAFTKWWRFYDVYMKHSHLSAIDHHKKYGKIVRIAPNVVSVADPKMISVIYSNREDFTKVGQQRSWRARGQVSLYQWSTLPTSSGRGIPQVAMPRLTTTERQGSIQFSAYRGRRNQR